MVLRNMAKTEFDYHLRFLSYSKKCVGVPWDPGGQKIIFPSLKKIQKNFRMVLTIDSPIFLDIDQKSQKNHPSKINGFRVTGAQKRQSTRTLTFDFSGYTCPILVIFLSKYMFLSMLNPSEWLKNTYNE